MGSLEYEVVSRENQLMLNQPSTFLFIHIKQLEQHLGVSHLEIVGRKFNFGLMMNIAVFNARRPFQIVDVIDSLQIHGDPLAAVGNLRRNRFQIDAAHLLKVGELGDLHTVQPDLPAEAPSTESRRLPVVLDKTDIVPRRANAEAFQGIEIEFLNVHRRRFHDHLKLVIVLQPIGIFTVTTVRGATRRLDIGHLPGFGTENAQKGRRMKSSGALFKIIRLLKDTPLASPVVLQGKNKFLKCHNASRLLPPTGHSRPLRQRG